MQKIVIVGGGHAAAQLCASLAACAFQGGITLVSPEPCRPYHRPPLSKSALMTGGIKPQDLRGSEFYEESGIRLYLNTQALAIDRRRKVLLLRDCAGNSEVEYDQLVLATGAAPKLLPVRTASDFPLMYLRTHADAVMIREKVSAMARLAVVGGGFIGLEVACTLQAMGIDVTVFARDRLLGRVVSPAFSHELLRLHRVSGLHIEFAAASEERLAQFDAAIVGIGCAPNIGLAQAAGLACDDGIVVDESLRTTDACISAIGDCASFMYEPWQRRIRIESVYNANAQAKALALRITGAPSSYRPVPWFWSDQGSLRLQMAGMWRPGLRHERVPAAAGGFALYHYDDDGALVASECIGAAQAHMAARRRLESCVPA